MGRESKFAKNILILAFGTLFPRIATFITLPLLTQYLTTEEYGTYDLVITLVSLVLPATTLQIQYAAFRFLIDCKNDEEEKKSVISNLYAFIIVVSIITLGILCIWLNSISAILKAFICIYFFLDIISCANKQIVRGLGRTKSYSVATFISSFAQILFIFILVVWVKNGLLGGVISLCLAEFFSVTYILLFGGLYKYLNPMKIDIGLLKKMIGFSWPMVPNTLSSWIMHVSDRLVITFAMGVSANAVYAVAYKIPSMITIAYQAFNMAWQENASSVVEDKDVPVYYSKMFCLFFDVVSGATAMLIGFTPIIFKILIRGDYDQALSQIPVLYMGIYGFCLSAFWGGLYVAFKKTKAIAFTTGMAAAVNLFIDVLFINKIGLYAASISTLVGYILLCVIRAVDIKKYTVITYNVRKILVVILILILQCIISSYQNIYFKLITAIIGIVMMLILYRKFWNLIPKMIKGKKRKL